MSYRLVIRRVAQAEFDAAFDWYEQQRPGLGLEFAERVQAVFDQIEANPELRTSIFREVRKAPIRPFPYSVFYRIRGDRVVVLAVFHSKRDPKIWQSRA